MLLGRRTTAGTTWSIERVSSQTLIAHGNRGVVGQTISRLFRRKRKPMDGVLYMRKDRLSTVLHPRCCRCHTYYCGCTDCGIVRHSVVSLFRHCPSSAKRPWELAVYRLGMCSSVIPSTRTARMAGCSLPATKFSIPSRSRTTICCWVPTRIGGHHVALGTQWNVSGGKKSTWTVRKLKQNNQVAAALEA